MQSEHCSLLMRRRIWLTMLTTMTKLMMTVAMIMVVMITSHDPHTKRARQEQKWLIQSPERHLSLTRSMPKGRQSK